MTDPFKIRSGVMLRRDETGKATVAKRQGGWRYFGSATRCIAGKGEHVPRLAIEIFF